MSAHPSAGTGADTFPRAGTCRHIGADILTVTFTPIFWSGMYCEWPIFLLSRRRYFVICTQLTIQISSLRTKISMPPEPVFRKHGIANPGHVRSIDKEFCTNLKVGTSTPPESRHFCLKHFDTFLKISVGDTKINTAAYAQLTFQMLTFETAYMYIPSNI